MATVDKKLESKLGFDKVRALIADRCATEYAARRAAEEAFSTHSGTIRKRLALTDEMRLVLLFEEHFPTTGYIDALPFLVPLRKAGSSIDTLSLAKLKTMLDTLQKVLRFFSGIKDGVYPQLKRLCDPVRDFPDVQHRIETILDRFGDIKDGASDELFAIRRALRDKEAAISRRAAAILRQAQDAGIVEGDAGVAMRDGKYLIPVSAAAKRKIPGYVYDESASGKTCYVEPADILELENEISGLRNAEKREIARILAAFTEYLRPFLDPLAEAASFLGEIDFLMAKAGVALDFIAGMPAISQDGRLDLRKARHPLLEKALKRENREIVPLTITLTPQKRILLISGPNAGGKSVCLKTTGLLQYMFQWGMLIPTSESSEMPVFDRIIVSIGDDQSLENDLSTYSSFLADMRTLLTQADEKTLVLIDEFGSGTEPAAGGAIAEAILADIDRRGVYGVITTHYTNLKLYASGADTRVINGAMRYDTASLSPLFALETGLPGNSFAFELARKMRLPEPIVQDAESRAGARYVDMERNLRRIVRNRRALDEKLAKIKHTDKALEEIAAQYRAELEEIREQRKAILEQARKDAENIVRGAGAQVEKTIRDIKEAGAQKEQTQAARAELQHFLGALEERKSRQQRAHDAYIGRKLEQLSGRGAPKKAEPARTAQAAPLQAGEKVRVRSNGMVGEIARAGGKEVTVIIGNISSKMRTDSVERISANEFRELSRQQFAPAAQKIDLAVRERKMQFSPELDIRGERLNDALTIVMHYIDDALMLGVPQVRILHGKGTGVLHEEIQKYLRTVPGVSAVRDEDIRAGGSGVTIVVF
ncbi:MAG: Smr/MutS family protein [Bacteroidales bacterium]|nr:Smr/MutS family protein [Bacteroidales bacterium]